MAVAKQDILDAIGNMSVIELSQLIKEMEEKFGSPRSALGFAFENSATSVTHGVVIMMLAELTPPLRSASKLAAFSEWATPRSSAWRITILASRGWPSRSAIERACAGSIEAKSREASEDQSSVFMNSPGL